MPTPRKVPWNWNLISRRNVDFHGKPGIGASRHNVFIVRKEKTGEGPNAPTVCVSDAEWSDPLGTRWREMGNVWNIRYETKIETGT